MWSNSFEIRRAIAWLSRRDMPIASAEPANAAADEIERLRARNEGLRSALYWLTESRDKFGEGQSEAMRSVIAASRKVLAEDSD